MTSQHDIKGFLVRHLGLQQRGLSADAVPDSFDFLAEGLIDSLGLIGLIGAIEQAFGIEVDFEGLPDDDITRIGPLSAYIERYLAERRAEPVVAARDRVA